MTTARKILGDAVWDWLFRLLAVVSLSVGAWAFVDVRSLTECQQAYNEINNERTRILTVVTEQERKVTRQADDAQALLFTSPLIGKVEPLTVEEREIIATLLNNYQDALKNQAIERIAADKARIDNPVPPPPSQLCGN